MSDKVNKELPGSNLLQTWAIHERIVRYVAEAAEDAAMPLKASGKGRSAGEILAHINNVRLMWLKEAAPDLLPTVVKVEKEQSFDRDLLLSSLSKSGEAIGELLRLGLESGRIKGFKPHPEAFPGYLISHESYHEGELGMVLAQAGHPLDRKTAFGMWEWGVR
ncbi:MAG: hypothetical protein WEB00_11385 [Dehalococcoidia bacterium]